MKLLTQINRRVAKLSPTDQRNLMLWLDWKERSAAIRDEDIAWGILGAKLAAESLPKEDWNDDYRAWKKSNGKKAKTARRVLGRSR